MFKLYDIETNELVKTGTARELAKFVNRATSTITSAYIKGYVLAGKYMVDSNHEFTVNVVNKYDLYDVETNKKVLSNVSADEIAKSIYISKCSIYESANKDKLICDGKYLVRIAKRERIGRT